MGGICYLGLACAVGWRLCLRKRSLRALNFGTLQEELQGFAEEELRALGRRETSGFTGDVFVALASSSKVGGRSRNDRNANGCN